MTQLDQLSASARRLLPSMLDEDSGLFANKVVPTASGPRRLGSNALYSAMSVIGILNDDVDWQANALPLERTLDTLHALVLRASPPLNLLPTTIWALAAARDERSSSLVRTLDERLNASRKSSMELGLVLSALARTMDAFPESRERCTKTAALATSELLDRFSDSAQLFRGRSKAFRPSRQLDWLMTSFASQVYPIHGLAQFARATETSLPTQAKRAADRLVELQGPLGQWWWIYSVKDGTILDGYPVFSVHQDAMAFMALAPIQKLGLGSYDEELALGVRWMFGQNELGVPLVDPDRSFFARCIQRRGADADGSLGMSANQRRRVVLSSWGLRSPPEPDPGHENLEVLEEIRPYHLGWLLYARSLIKDC